jgi:arginyl-tRNA synthetase
MDKFRKAAISSISKVVDLNNKEINSLLETPPDSKLGDLSFPCFSLGKFFKMSPGSIAVQLRDKMTVSRLFSKIDVKGPYLNFYFSSEALAKEVTKQVQKEGKNYGSTNIGKGKKILIEHTSINPNASPHIGRARNALIGNSLVKIHKFLNFKPEVHYYVNDIGKQIAMLVLAAGNRKPKFSNLLNMYVEINQKIKKHPSKEKEVFDLLHKLEGGDVKVRKRFKDIVDICVTGQTKILSQLGIKYDYFDYESKYLFNNSVKNILKRLEKTGKMLEDEHGRLYLDLHDYKLPMKNSVFVLTRGDKTSLYGPRDLAYTEYKMKRAKNNILVLGEDQKLYYLQTKAGMDLLGLDMPDVVHYSFVLLKSGKMSTRQGKVVLLEDFMNEVYIKVKKEIKNRKRGTLKSVKAIGNSAVIYSILKTTPEKNVIFDLDRAVSFEGDTGPYLQYTHARINSLLKKKRITKLINGNLTNNAEREVLKKVYNFPDMVLKAYNSRKPSTIANYLIDLAKTFNSYYSQNLIISDNKELTSHRLAICSTVKQVLSNGLNLVGIEAVSEM